MNPTSLLLAAVLLALPAADAKRPTILYITAGDHAAPAKLSAVRTAARKRRSALPSAAVWVWWLRNAT